MTTIAIGRMHFSVQAFQLDRLKTYEQRQDTKPRGFWYSAAISEEDVSWESWCRSERFRESHLAFKYNIEIDDSKILKLSCGYYDILNFTRKYEVRDLGGWHDRIDWPAVSKLYSGIEIAPYDWTSRLAHDTFWYYGWDCASGCIWDLSAIKKFELITEGPVAQSVRAEHS